jgi:hypothetical protein
MVLHAFISNPILNEKAFTNSSKLWSGHDQFHPCSVATTSYETLPH